MMTVTADGATLDYGCDTGSIDQPLGIDDRQQFSARGTHSFGRGGPSQQDDPPLRRHFATYEGTVNGSTMRLNVVLPDLSRRIGEFQLERGRQPSLERCL
jgi:hypothetical protein